jgi:hypothetical protein
MMASGQGGFERDVSVGSSSVFNGIEVKMINVRCAVIVVVTLLPVLYISTSIAQPVCIDAQGESTIVSGDIPSARVEAVVRAKFAAVEQIAGVDVKSKTVVNNSMLLDDLVTSQTRGAVSNSRIITQELEDGRAKVVINVCVEPVNAKSVMSALALNTAISVYLPAKKLVRYDNVEYDDNNILAHAVIDKLAEGGFSVHDLTESYMPEMEAVKKVLNGGDPTLVRSLVNRNMANSVLVGRIEPTLSMLKGADAGYGISMPFHSVTARLSYRLMTKDISGKMVVLSAGNEDATGLASSQDDAYAEALKSLSEKFVPVIIEKILSRLTEVTGKIVVEVEDANTLTDTFALREQIQKITWVTKVEAKGIRELSVSYPENAIYLANGLSQKGVTLVSFTQEVIKVKLHQSTEKSNAN